LGEFELGGVNLLVLFKIGEWVSWLLAGGLLTDRKSEVREAFESWRGFVCKRRQGGALIKKKKSGRRDVVQFLRINRSKPVSPITAEPRMTSKGRKKASFSFLENKRLNKREQRGV